MPTAKSISQLPQISADILHDDSLFEVSLPIGLSTNDSGTSVVGVTYASRAISKQNLSISLIENTVDYLKENHGFNDSYSFQKTESDISSLISGDLTVYGKKTFINSPEILQDLSDYVSYTTDPEHDKLAVNLKTLKQFGNLNFSPNLDSEFGFATTLYNDTTNESRNLNCFATDATNQITNRKSFIFDADSKNTVQHEYVFKINPNQTESNIWVAPVSGIFTCYGWLDEQNSLSEYSNEQRWVALLGYESILNEWMILQVQPFIKNNYLSYVSFTFPVKAGMRLKIQTGFPVGTNSDKYHQSSSSLANHLANAFLGGVYMGTSAVVKDLTDNSYENIPEEDIYAKLEDLSAYATNSDSEAINSRIDVLSSQMLSSSINIDNIEDFVQYIDTETYTADGIGGLELKFSEDNVTSNELSLNGLSSYSQYHITEDLNAALREEDKTALVHNSDFYIKVDESTNISLDDPELYIQNDITYRKFYTADTVNGVFCTDDYFWYYGVPKNSVVDITGSISFNSSIKAFLEKYPSAGKTITLQCYLRYKDADLQQRFKLLDSVSICDLNSSSALISKSLPLKRGSILAFGIYVPKCNPTSGSKTFYPMFRTISTNTLKEEWMRSSMLYNYQILKPDFFDPSNNAGEVIVYPDTHITISLL